MPATTKKLFSPSRGRRAAVRMYCHGFGDCFLLALRGKGKTIRMVIDCGLLFGTSGGGDRMREVVDSLHASTGGKLDALIITHEHFDHLSGFLDAKELWETFEIKELWFPWTEDPDDDVAESIRKYQDAALGLIHSAERIGLDAESRDRIESLWLLAAYSVRTGDAMKTVRALNAGRLRYFRPGVVETLPSGAKAIVLGPPRDRKKIGDLLGKPGDTFGHLMLEVESLSGQLGLSEEANAAQRQSQLFAQMYCEDVVEREGEPLPTKVIYEKKDESWRRIDHEYLGAIETLALQLDSLTNNLSLALAFWLDERNVLLFPGDAQIGNWKSWGDQTYVVDGNEVTAEDLMRVTKLYKVGHHLSHNGTCITDRFELMPKGLISLAPLEEVTRWPSIPNRELEQALKGRGPMAIAGESGSAKKPFKTGQKSAFTGRPMYVECELK